MRAPALLPPALLPPALLTCCGWLLAPVSALRPAPSRPAAPTLPGGSAPGARLYCRGAEIGAGPGGAGIGADPGGSGIRAGPVPGARGSGLVPGVSPALRARWRAQACRGLWIPAQSAKNRSPSLARC